MRDKDLIYVSNAESVELYKVLTLISAVPNTAGNIANDVYAINNAGVRYGRAKAAWPKERRGDIEGCRVDVYSRSLSHCGASAIDAKGFEGFLHGRLAHLLDSGDVSDR